MAYIGGYRGVTEVGAGRLKGISAWLFWRSAYFSMLQSIPNLILVPMYWFNTLAIGRDFSRF